jgi:hypothetical protein
VFNANISSIYDIAESGVKHQHSNSNQSKPYQWSNTVNSVLALSAVIRVEPLSDQTKDYKIGICSSAKYASLTSKNKDWLEAEVPGENHRPWASNW